MLVVDASIVVDACLAAEGFRLFGTERLVAPPLLWSESGSALHELRWRGEISSQLATVALDRLLKAPITPRRPAGLTRETWDVADHLGWAKTYDGEYVGLARLLRCRLATIDGRLRRAASQIVEVIGPRELAP